MGLLLYSSKDMFNETARLVFEVTVPSHVPHQQCLKGPGTSTLGPFRSIAAEVLLVAANHVSVSGVCPFNRRFLEKFQCSEPVDTGDVLSGRPVGSSDQSPLMAATTQTPSFTGSPLCHHVSRW